MLAYIQKNMRNKAELIAVLGLFGVTCFIAMVYFWLLRDSMFVVKSDVAILAEFAKRMLTGRTMSDYYWEMNPPLAMIIMIPSVLISRIFDVSLQAGFFIQTYGYIFITFSVFSMYLTRVNFIDGYEKILLIFIYLAAQFIIPYVHFGDREHVVMIGLIPFLTYQAGMLSHRPQENSVYSFLILLIGGAASLIKPHYGIIPVAMIVLRVLFYKDIKQVFRLDVYALVLTSLAYAVVMYVFFLDYITIIAPDLIRFYSNMTNRPHVLMQVVELSAVILILFAISHIFVKQQRHRLVLWGMVFISLVALYPYYFQEKGFDYQKLPCFFIAFLALAYAVYFSLTERVFRGRGAMPAVLLAYALTLLVMLISRPAYFNLITENELRQTPLFQVFDRYCTKPCSYLMVNDSIDLIYQVPLFYDAHHISRMTSLWFLAPIVWDEDNTFDRRYFVSDEEREEFRLKYVTNLVEDFEGCKPEVALVIANDNLSNDSQRILPSLMKVPDFREAWAGYARVGQVAFDMAYYKKHVPRIGEGRKELFFDIYMRDGSAAYIKYTADHPSEDQQLDDDRGDDQQ